MSRTCAIAHAVLVAIALVGCAQDSGPHHQKYEHEPTKSTDNITMKVGSDTVTLLNANAGIQVTDTIIPPRPSREVPCPGMAYARGHVIPIAARRLAMDSTFSLSDPGSEPLDLADSMLQGSTRSARLFYFWVVSKSLKYSDGYYSEGVGNIGTSYLFSRPEEFISAWQHCIDRKERAAWCYSLAGEQAIITEGHSADTVMAVYRHRLDSVTIDLPQLAWTKAHLIGGVDSVLRKLKNLEPKE